MEIIEKENRRTDEMIFVTVGTHEQPFNRLVEYMDKWAAEHDEEVVIQSGFSTYEPTKASWKKLFPYEEMVKMANEKIAAAGGWARVINPKPGQWITFSLNCCAEE